LCERDPMIDEVVVSLKDRLASMKVSIQMHDETWWSAATAN